MVWLRACGSDSHNPCVLQVLVHPPGPLLDAAKAHGQTTVAVTDHGAMFGVPSFARAAAARGLKPVVGCEAYVVDGFDLGPKGPQAHKIHHITLLAQNGTGYRNLCRLITKAHLEGQYRRPRIHLGWLESRGRAR